MQNEQEKPQELFAVFAVRKGDPKPLIQTHMTFGRLMDEVILPFDSGEMFFIDGAPVDATKLDRIKIIRQKEFFNRTFSDLHYGMRWGSNLKKQELYANQYYVRLEALLRESGDDVTSQILKAYKTAIKPKLKDYLPNRETLLEAAVKVFTEAMKSLSGA